MALGVVVYTPLLILNIFFRPTTCVNAKTASSWKVRSSQKDTQTSHSS